MFQQSCLEYAGLKPSNEKREPAAHMNALRPISDFSSKEHHIFKETAETSGMLTAINQGKGLRRQRQEENVALDGSRKRGGDDSLQHRQHSGDQYSDITTEHSAVCNMTTVSNVGSTKTSSSSGDRTCQFRLRYGTSVAERGYAELDHNVEQVDGANDQNPRLLCDDAKEMQSHENSDDWLDLRLGISSLSQEAPALVSSPGLCTLKLLPDKPADCSLIVRDKLKNAREFDGKDPRGKNNRAALKLKPEFSRGMIEHIAFGDFPGRAYSPVREVVDLQLPVCGEVLSRSSSENVRYRRSMQHHFPTNDVSVTRPAMNTSLSLLHCLSETQALDQAVKHRKPPSCAEIDDKNLGSPAFDLSPKWPLQYPCSGTWNHLGYATSCSTPFEQPSSFRELIASSISKDDLKCTAFDHAFPMGTGSVPVADMMHPFKNLSMDTAKEDGNYPWPAKWHDYTQTSCKQLMSCRSSHGSEFPYNSCHKRDSTSSQGWPSEAVRSSLHMMPSREVQIGARTRRSIIAKPESRSIPGFWFAIQPIQSPYYKAVKTSKTSYVRVKDGEVPISAVKKYLAKKLGLVNASQVSLSCRGNNIEEASSLEVIFNDIWKPSQLSPQMETLDSRSRTSYNDPKRNIMILSYEIVEDIGSNL